MRTAIVLVDPTHALTPLGNKEVNECTCLEAIYIIRTYVIVVGILAILVLLHGDNEICVQRFQNVLVRTSRERITNHNILMLCSCTN